MSSRRSIFRSVDGEAQYQAAYDAALELWPISFEEMIVPTQYGQIHLVASGRQDAPPLVLLHMMSMSATMWFPNVARLSQQYRVYAVDVLHDLGKSIPERSCQTRSASAEWLQDLLDGLGIEAGYLLGASYGGWLALNLVIHHPGRVKKLALLAPAGALKRLSFKFFATMGPAALFPYKWFLRIATRPMAASGFEWNDQLLDQLRIGLHHRSMRSLFGMALPGVFPDEELQRIDMPVLLLLGDHEIIYNPYAALDRAKRLIPNIDAEIIPDVGHGLSQEKPELVDARILEFFAAE